MRQATHAETIEARSRWRTTWAPRLSLPDLLAEEAALDAHPFGATFRTMYVQEDGSDTSFTASCEVLSLPAAGGRTVWLLVCLFVPPSLRGAGAASRLVSSVVQKAKEAVPSVSAVVLFSDISPTASHKLGFVVVGGGTSADTVLPPVSGAPPPALRPVPNAASVEEVDGLLQSYCSPPSPHHLGPLINGARLDWHEEVARFRSTAGLQPALSCRGMVGPHGFVLWRVDDDELVVLVLRGEVDTTAQLLAAAQHEAAAAGLQGVRVWDDDAVWVRIPGATSAPRKGKTPMVAWVDSGLEWGGVERAAYY